MTAVIIPVVHIETLDEEGNPQTTNAPASPFPANAARIECDGVNYTVTIADIEE